MRLLSTTTRRLWRKLPGILLKNSLVNTLKNNGNKNTFIQLAGKLKYKGIIIDLLNLVHNESHDLVEEIETSLHYISKSGSDTFVKILNDDSLSEEAISLALDVLKNPDEPFASLIFILFLKNKTKG